MDKYGKAARLLFGGAGLLLVFGACSDDQSPAAGSLAPIVAGGAGATTQVGGTTAVEVTTPLAPGATAAPVDGAALLQQAVAATSAGYHFNQTATVDGVVALTIDGDRLSDGARLAVSNEAGLVFYIITPDGTWLMPENGEWEADDSAPPAVDPIAALSAPTAVSVAANDGNTVQLVVTVPLGSLGIQGDGDASLQVAVVGGALNTLSYSTPTADGRTATATVIFGPVVDSTPVEAPI
ncbi:MAG: hypothetical protein ABI894_08670 [Ilumatobacteraceae bacterium]